MKLPKKTLLSVAEKVSQQKSLTPGEINLILSFNKEEKEKKLLSFLKKAAVPVALTAGFLVAVFPHEAERLVAIMPSWTNLPESVVFGADYIWNIIGEPVGKVNILYHFPNIILYAFGIVGVKKLIDAIDRKTWVDKVNIARKMVQSSIEAGDLSLQLKNGHSALFLGKGDFIGMQFVLDNPESAVAIAEIRPSYTNLWNYYSVEHGYEDLKKVMGRVCGKKTGEYVFFPVKDEQIFLPSPHAYDLSPHKIDILCQDVRTIEKMNGWAAKKIIIIGDKFHQSFVRSEDERRALAGSEDTISLRSISERYSSIILLDPTDIVLRHIMSIAKGRKIVFRATKEGIKEYKKRFYVRLNLLGYKVKPSRKGILTIGYDLFEDLTEQQTLSKTINDYYPVVLSKSVQGALLRNGYKKEDFIYVPELVLKELSKTASAQ